jgi:ABC-type transport system involved in multi-copper enzyme maturation permease subunit
MTRLIRADVLKLQRRRGMVGVVGFLVFASVAIYYGVGLVLHATDASRPLMGGVDTFDTAMGVLTLLASVAGAIIGATAGGADIESGVFRDLVATGRSRTALFFSRVPAAWILTLGMLAIAVAAAAVLAVALPGDVPDPSLTDILRGGLSVLTAGALTAAVCVGLAALTGSRGPVMGIALAFQLGVAPLLAQLDVLGDARLAIPAVAISRLDGADGIVAALPLAGAIGIILAWAAAGLGGGLWRTRTQEI